MDRKRKAKEDDSKGEPVKFNKLNVSFDPNDPHPFGTSDDLKIPSFVDNLSESEKFRLKALENLEEEYRKIRQQYKEEHEKLLEKYQPLYEPLWKKRAEIINGKYEPTEEDLNSVSAPPETPSDTKGITGFWLNVLKQHGLFVSRINPYDEKILLHLDDIKSSKLAGPSFSLEFRFSENPYFSNQVLKKTYILKDNEMGIPVVEKVEGTVINWKQSQPPEDKKKRSLNSPLFFQYFDDNEDVEDEDEEEELQEKDLEYGLALSESIVPFATTWAKREPSLDLGPLDSDEDEEEEESDGDVQQETPAECKQQ